MNPVKIYGDIDHASFDLFEGSLHGFDPGAMVDIRLCSDGGSPTVALAFYDLIMKMKKDYGVAFTCTATGLVASAATLILAACDSREMTPNAWVMIHEGAPDVSDEVHSVSNLESLAKVGRKFEDQWNALLAKHTGTDASVWAGLHAREQYLTPQQCLEIGLITRITDV